MKFILFFIICLFCTWNTYAEKVPAGYVAKWETTPLSELDYEVKLEKACQSFEGTLKKDKDVWDLLIASFPDGTVSGAPKI